MLDNNSWSEIPVEGYEKHMSDKNVFQLQTLNQITKEQIFYNAPNFVAIFGVATGNGLEYCENLKSVSTIDINNNFLDVCKKRYDYIKNTNFLYLNIEKDDYNFFKIDLIIYNLVFEYINEDIVLKKIKKSLSNNGVLSIVIQKTNSNSFVNKTKYAKRLKKIDKTHHDIEHNNLIKKLKSYNFSIIFEKEYLLPNGKSFIRIDSKKGQFIT